ncbi:MAG TPA: prolyl oligopeptidase family serine peptidase [Kofleriaceae bacterium]|nr:prolyl oligopeptidase family serine peptidase [Kofleriaceae bacterium]
MAFEDPWRWMETDPARLERWLCDHHASSESALASELRDELRTRLGHLASQASALGDIAKVGDTLFYARREPGHVHRTLWRQRDGHEEIAFDVTAFAPDAILAAWRVGFTDDEIAVNVAPAGSEVGTLWIVANGVVRPDRIANVHHEFLPGWLPDRAALLVTKIDPTRLDPVIGMRLWLHEVGRPDDELVFVPELPIGLPWAITSASSPWIAVCVQGKLPGLRVYVARAAELAGVATPWREVLGHDDLVEDIQLDGDRIYALVTRDSPNRRIDVLDLASGARSNVVAPSEAIIEGFTVAADAIYVRASRDGRAQVRRVAGDRIEQLEVPAGWWVSRIAGDPRSTGIVAAVDDWLRPTSLLAYEAGSQVARALPIAATAPAGLEAFVVERFEISSHDGERIPLTVLRGRGIALDGSHPTILEAYGGYGMSLTPALEPIRLAWLERGGIYAIAHVRGGGEKGHAWHLAGKGANKPNAIEDFVACARALCDAGYTRPRRIAATGLSMGGVVIGGALVAAPDLFGAIAIHAGLLNATRYLHGVAGEPQRPELGSPDDEVEFRALQAMDVYEHLRDDVRYPPVLITVGLNDERVSPWMSAKVVARLAAANNPVFVRVDREGHGMTATAAQLARRLADTWAFFAARLT